MKKKKKKREVTNQRGIVDGNRRARSVGKAEERVIGGEGFEENKETERNRHQ